MAEKIYIFSPQAQTGKTTIANYLALRLAKDSMVALVEINRYSSYSLFLHDKTNEIDRSIVNVYNNEDVDKNLIQSAHSEKCFFLSKNWQDDFMSLRNINTNAYKKALNYLDKNFDYCIIDMPSNYIEKMLIDALYEYDLQDHFIVILDDNIQTYQLLKHYDNYFDEIELRLNPSKTHFVKNKTKESTKDLDRIIESLTMIRSKHPGIVLPNIDNFVLYGNEGKMVQIPGDKKEKQFLRAIEELADRIIHRSTEEDQESKKKRFFPLLNKNRQRKERKKNEDRQPTNPTYFE